MAETQFRARIEVWGGDLVRLWGGSNSASSAFAQGSETEMADERLAEVRHFSDEIYGY
jgi:hypothetical protein